MLPGLFLLPLLSFSIHCSLFILPFGQLIPHLDMLYSRVVETKHITHYNSGKEDANEPEVPMRAKVPCWVYCGRVNVVFHRDHCSVSSKVVRFQVCSCKRRVCWLIGRWHGSAFVVLVNSE